MSSEAPVSRAPLEASRTLQRIRRGHRRRGREIEDEPRVETRVAQKQQRRESSVAVGSTTCGSPHMQRNHWDRPQARGDTRPRRRRTLSLSHPLTHARTHSLSHALGFAVEGESWSPGRRWRSRRGRRRRGRRRRRIRTSASLQSRGVFPEIMATGKGGVCV
jgi:hypothetical protein